MKCEYNDILDKMARNWKLLRNMDGRKIAMDLFTSGVIDFQMKTELQDTGTTDSIKSLLASELKTKGDDAMQKLVDSLEERKYVTAFQWLTAEIARCHNRQTSGPEHPTGSKDDSITSSFQQIRKNPLLSSERTKQMHSTSIQIRNVNLLSEQILNLYFENERQSHGGKVANIVFEKAYDRAIIDFEYADVAERVLSKNDHSLVGQCLYVSKLPPQCDNQFYFENIPKWVTINLLKIYLEAITHSSIDNIRFGKNYECAIISFHNKVFDLQRKLNKRPFIDDDGRQMNDVKIHPIVHPDAVLVYSKFLNIDCLICPIKDFLSTFKDKVSPNIRSVFAKEESNTALVIFEDYRAVPLLKDSLTVGDNTFSISPFFDHLGWVPQGRKTNVIRGCHSSRVTEKLSPLQIEFLSKPVGINFVHAEVDKQQWHCVFEITEQEVLVVISETKAISEQIIKYILECMRSVDYILDDAMMKSLSEKGSELQHLVSDKDIRNWFCYSQNESLLTILAASSEIEVIKQDVERFFSDNAMYEATIVENEMYGKYLKKFNENDLMKKYITKCNGIIPFKFKPSGVMVASGAKHQIQMLTVDVNNLLSHVKVFHYITKTFGMTNHFQSQTGLKEISLIADKSETIIDVDYDSKFDTNNVALCNDGVKLERFLNQNLKFVVVHGDIRIQNVDCIVNTANANLDHSEDVAAAIAEAGGQQIQKECSDFIKCNGPLDVSDVFVSNAGNLPCKKVIHVCGPCWKGGTANEERKLSNAVVACIEAAKLENLRSIAFPAVSTKIFGFPPEKAVPVIIDAIIKATGSSGPLHEIMLIDTDENTTKLFLETIGNLNGFNNKNQSAISKSAVQEFGQVEMLKKYAQSNGASGKKTQKWENVMNEGESTATDKSASAFARTFDRVAQSTINQYEIIAGKLSTVQERATKQSITLCICGPSPNVQQARSMLDELHKEIIISSDIICHFDSITIAKLHQQALMFSVDIEVIKDQCKVIVKGFQTVDFQNFLTDVLNKMKEELNEVNVKKTIGFNKIQIRNIILLSEEILHLYFENERRSHGGKVTNIIFEKAYDRAIIDFDNTDVAERVLSKNDHSLVGQRLYVSKLPPQCDNQFYFENIPKWVTLSSFKYYLEARSQSLIEDIQFTKDNKGAIVSFQNEVFDLQNKLNTRPFEDDNGRQMDDVKIHPVVYPNAVLVCGTFLTIDHLIYPIEGFLSSYQDKVSPNIRSVFAKEESNTALVIFEDYRAVPLLKDSLTVGDNTFSISPFFDHLGWVPQGRKTNVIRGCHSSRVTEKLSPLQIEFLSKPVGINFVHAEVDKQQWHCVFEITEQEVLVVISETKAISEQIIKYILECMRSVDYILDDAMMKSLSEKGSELQHLVSDKDIRNWFCYSQNESLLTILAASSEIELIKQDVERIFSGNVVSEATIVESEMHGKYLKKFHENDLMLKYITKCNGIIPFKFKSNGAMVASGTKDQIQMLTFDVNKLLSHIKVFPYIIKKPGMASHFQSQTGLIGITLIGDMSGTIIDVNYYNKFDTNGRALINDEVKFEEPSSPTTISKSVIYRTFDLAVQSTINQYEKIVGKLSIVQERATKQSITLCICGPSPNVQQARSMLDDELHKEIIISSDIICHFDSITIARLHQLAMMFSVEIKVTKERCEVKIKGYRAFEFHKFLIDVLDKMKNELPEVSAKWYKRKDASSTWDEIEVDIFRLEKEYQHFGGQGCTQFESEYDGLVSIVFDRMVILSAAKEILYKLKRLDSSDIPPEWDWDGKCLIDYKLVELQSNSLEYSTVSNAVSQTANVIIEKIERVENPCKYQQFVALKRKMEQSVSGVRRCVAEKYLFHGTGAENVPGICTDGFNRTLLEQNEVNYEHGLCFARDFSYSARPNYESTAVFYARVLTGNYTKGTTDMKVAPFVDASKNLKYDSVVDDIDNPSIYVVFSDNHAYPAYVITYKAQ